ncbi:hypothetical protein [Kineococcus sp. SYSU DK004]|uniref:hypothetical protein n=1 Tax=Kineococcus sp. SYSU DK004 TaxID=3383125 RepID=UPI003D7F0C7E
MTEVEVRADGAHRYAAVLTTGSGSSSEHVVTADEELLARLDVTAAEEPVLVRRVLEVLAAALDEAERDDAGPGDDPAGGRAAVLPTHIDLAALERERPELLRDLPLR